MTASAKAYLGASRQTEGLLGLIHNFKIAFDAQRTIVANSNFCGCHLSLRSPLWIRAIRCGRKFDAAR